MAVVMNQAACEEKYHDTKKCLHILAHIDNAHKHANKDKAAESGFISAMADSFGLGVLHMALLAVPVTRAIECNKQAIGGDGAWQSQQPKGPDKAMSVSSDSAQKRVSENID